MGAYLYFKTENNPTEVNEYLETNEIQQRLIELDEQCMYVVDQEQLDWLKVNRPDILKYEEKRYAMGDIKTSGGISRKSEEAGLDEEDLAEMWVQIFEELNKRFKMKYYAHSCSLNPDSAYFTIEQMKRITDNGKLLSGKSSKSEHVVELYNKYYALFSESESVEPFDITIIKNKDEVMIDGIWRKVQDRYGSLKVQSASRSWITETLSSVADKIEGHRKYVPKIRYNGAICDIEAYIKDGSTLIFLEIIGQETMVKSVSSVLMQGRTRMNEHSVDSDAIGWFDINKASNKRKMIQLEDGIAHAIVHHSPSIIDINFNVLIGRDKDELLISFNAWLEKSQPLPYPKELSKKLYEKLQSRSKITELTTYGIEAVKVDMSILEDDGKDLQEYILEVCKENGLIALDAKPMKLKAPLPKSPLLTVGQVQKIYDTLSKMPKTYELNDVKIKPIGLKLFVSSMTWYVVEADAGSPEDEFEGTQRQAFGYVVNESYPECSEWGYIDIDEVVQNGAEMDLYFDDMYIKSNGQIGILAELQEIA
jgi:hypothetical protein